MPQIDTDVEMNPMEQAVCMVLAMQRYANNRSEPRRASGLRTARPAPPA
jgi:hypothetical protein